MLTKTLLKNSLMELLETQDIRKISIKELCEHAGINRSTFYRYYGSQFDVLKEIEADSAQNVIAILESHPEDRAAALLGICCYLERNALYIRPLLNNSSDSEFVKMILSHHTIRQEIWLSIESAYDKENLDYVFDFIAFGSARIIQN